MTRKILNTFMAALLLSGCHGVVDIPEPVLDTTEALELSMCTAELTKAMIKSTTLPNGSSVGITVRDDYGAYIGELCVSPKPSFRIFSLTPRPFPSPQTSKVMAK